MSEKKYIQELLKRIDEFNIYNYARIGYISLMQLYRDFYSLTGHSVNEYIRKRRMSNALTLIKHSAMSITDIAFMCNYSSHQNFTKAVKKEIGLSPSDYRKSDMYFYFPAYVTKYDQHITVKKENIPETISASFFHSKLEGIENRALDRLFEIIPNFNGRVFGRQGKQINTAFRYELYLTEAKKYCHNLANGGFGEIHIHPAHSHRYASTIVNNNETQINESWNYLYDVWLKSSMFAMSDAPYFEEYLRRDGNVNRLKLYLPIKKSCSLFNIFIENLEEKRYLSAVSYGYRADELASDKLTNFIRRHPSLKKINGYQILVIKNKTSYICAVPAENELPDISVEQFTIPKGVYATVECECCDDYSAFETMLISFIDENGFERDGFPIFAIYETDNIFENIKLKIYGKIKNVKIGKV